MTAVGTNLVAAPRSVQPADVLTGLGSADRHLLAACLALFEDSTLFRRLEQIYRQVGNEVRRRLGKEDVQESTASVQTRMAFWLVSKLSDNDLRLILWIYLRDAFGLPARLSVSMRGAERLADDLAAAAIHAVDPPGIIRAGKDLMQRWGWMDGKKHSVTLSDVVLAVLEELLSAALKDGAGQMNGDAQEKLFAEVRTRLEQMDEAGQRELLNAVGAKELNDAAIRKILLTGGGLTAFSAGVGMAGFSAYILAAQASVFIPLISGPALVSVVAVISNPITVVAATGAALWWITSSANKEVRAAVGVRVLALLALQGLNAKRSAVAAMLTCFPKAESLKPEGDLEQDALARYQEEWKIMASAVGKTVPSPDPHVMDLLDSPAIKSTSSPSGLERLLFPGDGEVRTTAAVAALTLGDIAYSAAAIDPTVIQAADFARADALDSPLAFAEFARKIQELSPASHIGDVSNLKGYVAERIVAAELVDQGHQVSFPDTPNEPGWDLMVDGEKFQVKCLEHLSGLRAHFDNYDYPVLANSELADHIPSELADKVFFVEGYSNELADQVTERSLDAGADVFSPHVPIFALGMSAARNLLDYQAGKVSATQAVEQIILDGGIRVGLATAGGYIGASIGLLVFGPAGALVLGAVTPVLSQAQARRFAGLMDKHIKAEPYTQWETDTHRVIDEFVTCLEASIERKRQFLRDKYKALGTGDISDYVRYRLADDARFLRESRALLAQLTREHCDTVEQRALDVIRWTAGSTVHPALYQSELFQLNEVLKQRPSLPERLEGVLGKLWDLARGTALDLIAANKQRKW